MIHSEHTIKDLVLDVKNLTVISDDNITLVDDVSFKVHSGEVFSIAGVSGNGQVEIADAIAGLIPTKSGSVKLLGKELIGKDIRYRTEQGMSYIPEDRHSVGLILDFNLRENLLFKEYYKPPYCNNRGILNFNEMNTTSEKLIVDFDIRCSNGRKTLTRSMSGGNQQKAIIAREIHLSSTFLIFVQPTRGLDIGAIESIHHRIDDLRAQGKAILLISLELDEIMELSDTIMVMYNGKVQTIKEATSVTKLQVGEYMMGAHVEKNNYWKKFFVFCCGPGKHQLLRTSLFCIVVSLFTGALLLLVLGKNPLEAYKSILQGAGLLPKLRYAGKKSQLTDFMSLLNYTTPMIFAALSVAVALKSGIFNICVSGIMVISGFMATIVIGYTSIDPILAKILVIIIGMSVGAIVGALIGWLKYKFNMNEVVVAIMLNYIISYVVSFFIQTRFVDPISRQSVEIGQHARLTLFNYEIFGLKMEIPLMFPIAILVVLVLRFLINKTKFGFELQSVGVNTRASKYAGIHVGKILVSTMIISGALAGLAGVTFYVGTNASIQPRVLPSLGFDAIAVALLGNLTMIGSMFSSLLVVIFDRGTTYMSSRLSVLREIAAVITSILLLFSAIGIFFRSIANRYSQEMEGEK